MKKLFISSLLFFAFMQSSYAQEKPTEKTQAQSTQDTFIRSHKIYREKTVKAPSGTEKKIREEVKSGIPGEELIGVMYFKYNGDKPADNVVLTLPLEKEFIYVEGSATDENYVWFSADNGKTYSRFKDLRAIDENGVPRIALGKDVTHLQWRRATPLKKGQEGTLEYRVIIK